MRLRSTCVRLAFGLRLTRARPGCCRCFCPQVDAARVELEGEMESFRQKELEQQRAEEEAAAALAQQRAEHTRLFLLEQDAAKALAEVARREAELSSQLAEDTARDAAERDAADAEYLGRNAELEAEEKAFAEECDADEAAHREASNTTHYTLHTT
eukprot:1195317-Prorocentrum_minimum.AAC.2